jgi:hypothetical protein
MDQARTAYFGIGDEITVPENVILRLIVVGIDPVEAIRWAQLSYRIGFNPLPHLREIFPHVKWTFDGPGRKFGFTVH